MASSWPLVGRQAELARIAEAADRGCCGVVVRASAGVGKSRLGREALAAAERDGAHPAWVQATRSSAEIPLGAFASVLPGEVRSEATVGILRESARALHERAGGRPIVLGVDDAQLLDPVSATLVAHLATGAGVFVIATVRSGEPCPDAIVSLWKDAGAPRLELGRLSDAAVGELVEKALDGPVEQEALRWLVDRSEGNPLYARELVLGALDAGRLTFSGGLWRLSGRLPVSTSLAELVEDRTIALTAEQRAPVELLALGEPLRLPELVTLTSYDALADAESHGLVTIDSGAPDPEVRLAHPLYGDVLRERLPALRARALRLRLAATLQERDPLAPDDALRVARLLLDGGAEIPPLLAVDAARAANLAGDPALGAQLAELGLATGASVDAALALARAQAMRQRFEEGEAALASVEDQMPGDASAIDYLEQRMRILVWGLDRVDETCALLDRAQTWFEGDAWQRRLVALRLPIAAADDPAGALATARALLDDPELDVETRGLLEPRYAARLATAGRWSEAHALSVRYRPPVPIQDLRGLALLPIHRTIAVEAGIDWPDLESYLSRTLQDGVRAHDHEAAGQAATGIAHLHFLRGRLRDATRWLAEAELHFEIEDAFGLKVDVWMLQLGTAYLSGDPDRAAAVLARLRALDLRGRPPLTRAAYMRRAEGWAACARSPAGGAAQLLADAEALAEEMPGFAAVLAYDALVAGCPASRVNPVLAPLAARCDAPLIDAYAAHAAARDGGALLRVAGEFAAIGATRYAANAAAQAGSAFVREGRQDSARRAATRVRELHEADQGLEPPEIDGLAGAAVELTARENQLVALARQGLTNAEIADRLVLSVRTVESHLYRAMNKLGISDRRDL